MPLVMVHDASNSEVLLDVTRALPALVAQALHVEEDPAAHLTANDVEVWVRGHHPHDKCTQGIEIVVWANLFPERNANLEERTEMIAKGVRAILAQVSPGVKGFVWVLLQPGAFSPL